MKKLASALIFILVLAALRIVAMPPISGSNTTQSAEPESVPIELWSFVAPNQTDRQPYHGWGSPVAVGDVVYVIGYLSYYPTEEKYEAERYHYIDSIYALNRTSGVRLWNFTLMSLSNLKVSDGLVYAVGGFLLKNTYIFVVYIYALDAYTGEQKWSRRVPDYLGWYTVPADDKFYTGGYWGSTYVISAVNATIGERLWSTDLGYSVIGPNLAPAVGDGALYFAVADDDYFSGDFCDTFYALNATNGQRLWNFSADGYLYGPSFYEDGAVYFNSEHTAYALNATDGETLWRYSPEGQLLSSYMAVKNRIVYVVGSQPTNDFSRLSNLHPTVYALNATNGEKLWNFTVNGFHLSILGYSGREAYTLNVIDGIIYVIVNPWHPSPDAQEASGDAFYALNATTGVQMWSHAGRPSAVDGGFVYCWTNQILTALRAIDGQSVWNYTTGCDLVTVVDDVAYFGSGYSLYAYDVARNQVSDTVHFTGSPLPVVLTLVIAAAVSEIMLSVYIAKHKRDKNP